MRRRTVYVLMAVHVCCAAVTYVLGKHAAVGFPNAGSLSLARAIVAAVALLALTGTAIPRPRFTGREWLKIAGLGVLLVPLNQYLFLRGLHDTVPGHAAIIYAMTPVGALVLQSALARKLPPVAKVAGVLGAVAGVVVLFRPWAPADAAFKEIRDGDLWIFAGLIVWVVYTVAAAPLFKVHDPRTVTTWILTLGGVVLAPFAARELAAVRFASIPSDAWWGLLWLGLVTSAGMMLLWNAMLRHLEPVEVSVCSNLQPAATALLVAGLFHAGWIDRDQDLGPLYFAGTALILGGVWLVQRRGPRPPEPVPAEPA
jgi:drug/metabolite transporter (DMT)-like permease